jgi:hypothetical protein
LLVDNRGVAVFFAVVVHYAVTRNYDVFVLTKKLFGTVESLSVELVTNLATFVCITNLCVRGVLYGHSIVAQEA